MFALPAASSALALLGSPYGEVLDGLGVEGDASPTGRCLQAGERRHIADGCEGMGDLEPSGVDLQVGPAQPEQLAASRPSRSGEPEQHPMSIRR